MRIFKRITAILISVLILISAIACNGENLLEGNTEVSSGNDSVSLTTDKTETTATIKRTPLITYSGLEGRRDACVLEENGVYYMYPTGWKCYVNRSGKLDGEWVGPFNVVRTPDDYLNCPWAPEVHKYNGMYYMFTTYQSKTTLKRGCTILRSDNPLGPFVEITGGLITPADWFCIDGTFYVDKEGQPWMIFTYEEYMVKCENGQDTQVPANTKFGKIYAAKLSEDLTSFIEEPVYLFKGNDPSWSTSWLADGPWLYTTEKGSLLMLWTNFDSSGYSVGISRSESGLITGPWIHEDKTLSINKLTGDVDLPYGGQQGGGHPSTFRDTDGQLYLCIHTPNANKGEQPVFIKIREKNDTLVWDYS